MFWKFLVKTILKYHFWVYIRNEGICDDSSLIEKTDHCGGIPQNLLKEVIYIFQKSTSCVEKYLADIFLRFVRWRMKCQWNCYSIENGKWVSENKNIHLNIFLGKSRQDIYCPNKIQVKTNGLFKV